MKTQFLILFVLVIFQSFGQITTAKVAEKAKEPKPLIYDSLDNFLGENFHFYKGQMLYLSGVSETLRKYGYRDFYNKYGNLSSIDKKSIYKCCVDEGFGSKYEELAEKYFLVLDILPHPKAEENEFLYGKKHYFKLKEVESGEECYFEYNEKYKHSFPFIVVGYFEKLKKDFTGKEYITRGKNWIDRNSPMTDMITGAVVSDFDNGKVWKCTDVSVETKYYALSLILTNELGQKIPIAVENLKSNNWIMDVKTAEAYRDKFGNENWLLILKGKIKIGMTEEMCLIAWGKPNKINRASYGDQWVYDDQYLYFENGKLKSFN